MVSTTDNVAAAATERRYFTVWRWHFYCSLYVFPFLMMLAVTGLIMLWISAMTEINGERTVIVPGEAPMAVSALEAAAEAAVPGGAAVTYIEPMAADRVAVFQVAGEAGDVTVVLNPYTGEVVETFPWRAGWYDFATEIHGTLLIGDLGDWLIEAAASLGVILVVTGVWLHWPRRGAGWRETLLPKIAFTSRGAWKALHGAVGMWMSVILLVFLISGLSWAGIWGGKMVQAWSTFPAEKWDAVPLSDKTHAEMNHGAAKEVPWGLEQTPLPESGSLAGTQAVTGAVDIDGLVAFARSLGFNGRFQLAIPGDETAVWTISHDSMSNDGPDPSADRTIHVDQYTGNVLADVGYADYSPWAKAMAYGIAFHEGDMGVWNLALNTVFCLSMIFLPVSGLVMWWKRRPEGALRLAAPPAPQGLAFWWGAAALVVVLGIAFPLGGAAIAAVILLDLVLLRQVPALRRVFS
ncbi:PepSY domain-containing protein [Tabrizicola sp. TH137]|uniref:PepSY-associated TM helix domain-containing protein n=1 Tax=Tabrizicola sp. TH137 TaxID=2067452 RepID=UPI000C7E578A|nr:PepSY domain-containing protein [Tabrizicola sp. TH137]PLL12617.1 PepSY domain-containing protein [Tabrizicola sp. TH137]